MLRQRAFHNGAFFDPVFKGRYPQTFVDACADFMPAAWQADLEDINQPLDFWGLNYYTPTRVKDKPGQSKSNAFPHTDTAGPLDGTQVTDIGWEICPQSLSDLLIELKESYSLPPCYITENGACFNDGLVDGRIDAVSYTHLTLPTICSV